VGQRADGELADAGQAFGQQPQHHAFSGARITADIESFRYQWL
jgi:hypothetical protein